MDLWDNLGRCSAFQQSVGTCKELEWAPSGVWELGAVQAQRDMWNNHGKHLTWGMVSLWPNKTRLRYVAAFFQIHFLAWNLYIFWLAHWGRVTHICVSKLTIIGSDNGLSPDRRQAIIWTNAGIVLIGPLGTNFSEILIEILTFSFKKMRLKVSSAKRRPFCLGLNVLKVPPDVCSRES